MQDGSFLKKMFWKWMKMGKQRVEVLSRVKNKSDEIIQNKTSVKEGWQKQTN